MKTANTILHILKNKGEMPVKDLVEITKVSRQMVHKALIHLLENNSIVKIGKSPKVYYQFKEPEKDLIEVNLSLEDRFFLEQSFIEIDEYGNLLKGQGAFEYWCKKRKEPIMKTLEKYKETTKKYQEFFDEYGVISGLVKLQNTKGFDIIGLEDIFYLDFYAIERFGKTKLGKMLHFAKQGQNKKLSLELIDIIKAKVLALCQRLKIDAVGFIPPTINRKVQIMDLMASRLQLPYRHIAIDKVTGEIIVPQKALSKLSDRMENARQSIIPIDKNAYDTILLIDDAVGSGSTLNETAIKIKKKGIAKVVYGLAITGSYKGFEVISEA